MLCYVYAPGTRTTLMYPGYLSSPVVLMTQLMLYALATILHFPPSMQVSWHVHTSIHFAFEEVIIVIFTQAINAMLLVVKLHL